MNRFVLHDLPHSSVGPSGADRWMSCPASAVLARLAGPPEEEERSSSYALEGTIAHKLFETCLQTDTLAWEWIGTPVEYRGAEIGHVDTSMTDTVEGCLEFVRSTYTSVPKADWMVEARLSLSGTPIFGWADVVIPEAVISVVDLKYGAGITVQPSSRQLGLYGIMAWENLGRPPLEDQPPDDPAFEAVVLQPRQANPIRRRIWTVEQALSLRQQAHEALERIDAGALAFEVGDHCRFCPVATCPQLAATAESFALAAAAPSPEMVVEGLFTAEELDRLMGMVPTLESMIRRVRKATETYLLNGGKLENAKLVSKKTRREWENEEAAIELLERHGVDPYTAPALISPAQAEKRLPPTAREQVKGMTHTPKGEPVMAPATDPRPALSEPHDLSRLHSTKMQVTAKNILDRKARAK